MIMSHFGAMKMIVLMKNYEANMKESNNDEAEWLSTHRVLFRTSDLVHIGSFSGSIML